VNDSQVLAPGALANGPLHSYAISTAIEELTGERLGPGSLYGALTRIEAKELPKAGHRERLVGWKLIGSRRRGRALDHCVRGSHHRPVSPGTPHPSGWLGHTLGLRLSQIRSRSCLE
jgi:hypothetical protein